MGDFNDTPESIRVRGLTCLSDPLFRSGRGTIRYEGAWELIDLVFVSPALVSQCRTGILHPPFLTVPDRAHGGMKPLRTWSGPRYAGGVSDHRPIFLLYAEPAPTNE